MKIYAVTNNELDQFIGQNIWIPVGFDDDGLYGWVRLISSRDFGHRIIYKADLLTLADVKRYGYNLEYRHTDSLENYISPYAFDPRHFDFMGIDQVITGDELEDEITSIFTDEKLRALEYLRSLHNENIR